MLTGNKKIDKILEELADMKSIISALKDANKGREELINKYQQERIDIHFLVQLIENNLYSLLASTALDNQRVLRKMIFATIEHISSFRKKHTS